MKTNIAAVRGAVDIRADGDESSVMMEAMGRLFKTLMEINAICVDDIISIQLTQTPDLRQKNAAAALRESLPELAGTPLFCSQEPDIDGAPARIVRVLLTVRTIGPDQLTPVYLGLAAALRPDLSP